MTSLTKFFGSLVMLGGLGYVAYFAVMNQALVTIYIWPQTDGLSLPLWLVSLSSFLIGLTFLALVANLRISALRYRLYQMQKKLDKALHMADEKTSSRAPSLSDSSTDKP